MVLVTWSSRPVGMLVGAVVGVVLAGLPAAPADAHTDLVSSSPGQGSVVDTVPDGIVLAFNEEMDPALGAVVLSVGGREVGRLDVGRGDAATELVARVDPLDLPDAGMTRWRVSYRVTSRDGHPVSGVVAFDARTPPAMPPSAEESTGPSGAATSAPSESEEVEESEEAEEAEESQDREQASLVSVFVVAGIVALALLLGMLALWRLGREEEADEEEGDEEEVP